MEYITSKELSEKWGIKPRRILYLAQEGRIEGARIFGKTWVFPKDAVKPEDGRTKEARKHSSGRIKAAAPAKTTKIVKTVKTVKKTPCAKEEFFRYPSLAHCDTRGWQTPLSAGERIIKESLEAFHACRYDEADRLLGDLPEKAKSRYCRIYSLYLGCMIDMLLPETNRFFDRYARLCVEMQKEFPHKAEMESLTHEIDACLGSFGYFKKEVSLKPGCEYHESFLPHFAALCAVALFYGGKQHISLDVLQAYELIGSFLESSGSMANLQSFHCYFGIACSIAKRTEEANEHFRKMFELAEKYELLFTPASEYYHMQELFQPSLSQFPKDFQKKIQFFSEDVHSRCLRFTEEAAVNSFFAPLKARDYLYVLYAAQGYSYKEIAKMLGKTPGAVGAQFHYICKRLHITGKKALVKKYREAVGETLLKQ